MNNLLLDKEVQVYINANLNSDLHSLLLKKSPFDGISSQEIVAQIKGRLVAEKKFPFLLKEGIIFPKNLSLEQSSSSETALYKKQLVKGKKMLDLTSGFGIDAYHLSHNFQEVTLVEQQKDLIDIVRHNWKVLNRKARFIHRDLLDFIEEAEEECDWVYLDPARRNENQNKVFLLPDLFPNILEIQHRLITIGKRVMIKLSPLIDISYISSEIKNLKEIHIIAVKNDVKELVIVLQQDYSDAITVNAINLKMQEPSYSYTLNNEIKEVHYSEPLNYLYIPNNAILKSGNFNGIANTFNLFKLDKNTHLYTSKNLVKRFPGRVLKIKQLSSKEIKKGEYYNVISKNHPLKPSQIKKKYGLKDGGNQYLIFTQAKNKKIILKSYDKY